jgi:hypothetical protein
VKYQPAGVHHIYNHAAPVACGSQAGTVLSCTLSIYISLIDDQSRVYVSLYSVFATAVFDLFPV